MSEEALIEKLKNREQLILQQNDKISSLEKEVEEQCRLNGAGASREAALMGKVERLEKESTALREGLEKIADDPCDCYTEDGPCICGDNYQGIAERVLAKYPKKEK